MAGHTLESIVGDGQSGNDHADPHDEDLEAMGKRAAAYIKARLMSQASLSSNQEANTSSHQDAGDSTETQEVEDVLELPSAIYNSTSSREEDGIATDQEPCRSFLEELKLLASQLTDDPVRLQLKPKLEPDELQIEWNLSVPEMTDKELEEAILAAHAEAQHLEDWRFEDFNESSQPPASAARPVPGNEEGTMLSSAMQGNQDPVEAQDYENDAAQAAYDAMTEEQQRALWSAFYGYEGSTNEENNGSKADKETNGVKEVFAKDLDIFSLASSRTAGDEALLEVQTSRLQDSQPAVPQRRKLLCVSQQLDPRKQLVLQRLAALNSTDSSRRTDVLICSPQVGQKTQCLASQNYWDPGEADVDEAGYVKVPVKLLQRYFELEAMHWSQKIAVEH